MADNFLEQRMDDLRNGRLRTQRSKVRPHPKGSVWVPDIASADPERLRALVRQGWRVYCGGGSDPLAAHRLARTLGCRYVPPGMQPPADCLTDSINP